MAKAVADGKPHLVPVYERRREATLVSLCQLTADIAAADALKALYDDTKRIADKITSRTETPKDSADLHRTHQALKEMQAAKPSADKAEVISLFDGLLAKYKRLQ